MANVRKVKGPRKEFIHFAEGVTVINSPEATRFTGTGKGVPVTNRTDPGSSVPVSTPFSIYDDTGVTDYVTYH